ncbi:Leucine-rich repeat [Sergentomyia squamirostris]
MKILCDVIVHNRQQPSANYKSAKSTLALGFHPPGGKPDSKLFVILFTAKSKAGTRYQLTDNLRQIFTRFVDEGKFTLSLKNPEIDLQVRCRDVTLLRNFLRAVNVALKGDVQEREKLRLSSLSVTPIAPQSRPVTKLSIARKSDYPSKGLPKTLTHLEILGLQKSRLDSQILYLKHLTHLNLSENAISKIPKPLGELCLVDLNLSGNVLGSDIGGCDFIWLEGHGVTKSLQNLDLSNNYLTHFPLGLTKLLNLCDLNLDNNRIKRIPFSVRNLQTLKSLSLESNELEALPGTLEMIYFDHINISNNNFPHHADEIQQHDFVFVPRISLLQIAARTVIKHKIPYAHPKSYPTLRNCTVPWIVADLLSETPVCSCGNICFDAKIYEICSLASLHYKCIISNADRSILADRVFCTRRCFDKRNS